MTVYLLLFQFDKRKSSYYNSLFLLFLKYYKKKSNCYSFWIFNRVFWRQVGVRSIAIKNDTKITSLHITGLKEGVTYECVVKAGNTRGTSRLTDPIRFATDDKYITSLSRLGKVYSLF